MRRSTSCTMLSVTEQSPAEQLLRGLIALHGSVRALELVYGFLDNLSVVDAAALAYDWAGVWARPKQCPPIHASGWSRWGFLTGRGFGKTRAIAHHINSTVQTSPGPLLICCIAQDEQSAIDIQIQGPSGLIATSPPWFKPEWQAAALQLEWPNGSRAYVRTPQVPDKIRGLEYHLTWASELQSWPPSLRDEAWYRGVVASTRLDRAQIIWDATPKRRHPILKELLADAERDPIRNVIVRGTTHENALNLGPGYVEDLEAQWGNTLRGREELYGEMLPESENALVRDSWIANARRKPLDQYVRRVVSIDPAVSDRPGSDETGIIEAGLGPDGQAYVLTDQSGKHSVNAWADIALDLYLGHADPCLLIAETNKGGQLVVQNLRAAATSRGLTVVEIGREERAPMHRTPRTIHVREVFARGAKEDRAEPIATAYERGRISHVGDKLTSLEDTLTTWEPAREALRGRRPDSPGDLDALVHGIVELLGLSNNRPDLKTGFQGIEQIQKVIDTTVQAPQINPQPTRNVQAAIVQAWHRGGRI